MKITVYMLAFNEEVSIPMRIVEVPDHEVKNLYEDPDEDRLHLLERVFFYGQNDFQPQPIRSVSTGDVIKLSGGSMHKVLGAGFEHLPAGTDLNTLPRGYEAARC